MQGMTFNWRIFSEYWVTYHYSTPLEKSNFTSMINRINFICYGNILYVTVAIFPTYFALSPAVLYSVLAKFQRLYVCI